MYEQKTKPTDASVTAFLDQVLDDQKRADSFQLVDIMRKISGRPAKLWGGTMVGFGEYHYRYPSGHEGDTFWVGFSPRKQALTLYFMGRLEDKVDLLARLGKHKTGVGCVYIKRLSDVNLSVLEEMIRKNVAEFL